MTSSERHVSGQRWDYNRPCYKENQDVFLEPGLISVIVLAHGRPAVTRESILSTLTCAEQYEGEIEWIFIENGDCNENYEFFKGLDLERKVIVRQRNYGINEGINQGWALSRGEYCMIHENDWLASEVTNFFQHAKDIFEENGGVGIVQLRAPLDPNENHGSGKPLYNPWSCHEHILDRAEIEVWKEETKSGHAFMVSVFPNGFNNNPIIMRKSIYRDCGPYPEPKMGSDPRHGESEYQIRVAKLSYATAHIGVSLYHHMGHTQTQAQ